MYKAVSVILSLILLISLAACGGAATSGEEPSNSEPASSSSSELQISPPGIDLSGEIGGEITVSAYDARFSKALLEDAARLFIEKYPGTTVNVETFSAMPEVRTSQQGDIYLSETTFTDDPQARQDYINRLNTELMSGGGADVLSMDVLPVYKYAQAGQLENLAGYMDADPDFNRDDYQANVLGAAEYKGGLWFMPLSYTFDYYSYDSTLITGEAAADFSADSAVTFSELMAVARPLLGGDAKLNNYDDASGLWQRLFDESYASFVDLENKTANFNDGSFAALLETAAQYSEDGYLFPRESADSEAPRRVFFKPMASYDMGFKILEDFSLAMMSGGTVIVDDDKIAGLAALSGGGIPFASDNAYGINSNSDNKATAWAFIKFLLSEEIQLNKIASGVALPVLNSARAQVLEASIAMFGGDVSDTSEVQGTTLTEAIANANEAIERMSARINCYVFEDATVNDMIAAEVEYFFDGSKTAAEVAGVLQSKVELYLNE